MQRLSLPPASRNLILSGNTSIGRRARNTADNFEVYDYTLQRLTGMLKRYTQEALQDIVYVAKVPCCIVGCDISR